MQLTTEPPGEAWFDRAMADLGPFEDQPDLALAVSGGGDSRALALLGAAWARARGGRAVALIVDHGLRAEAAAEAERVSGWMRAGGLAHHILRPATPPPGRGLQAWAREVRLDLLAEWCRREGILHLLLAHQRDDQAETHLMRRARGAGPGEAAMPALRVAGGVRWLRPLLAAGRVELRDLLRARGLEWIEDPSNTDRRFERIQRRLTLDDEERTTALAGAGAAAKARRKAERELAAAAARLVTPANAGYCLVEVDGLAALPHAMRRLLLARLALTVGGGPYAPGRAAVARLDAALAPGAGPRGHTLGGCRFMAWRKRLLVCREYRAATLAPPRPLGRDGPVRWDRFEAEVCGIAAHPRPLLLAALGEAGPAPAMRALPAAVRPTLPALHDDRGPVLVPDLGFRRADAGRLSLRLAYRPPNPLVPYPFEAAHPCAPATVTANCRA